MGLLGMGDDREGVRDKSRDSGLSGFVGTMAASLRQVFKTLGNVLVDDRLGRHGLSLRWWRTFGFWHIHSLAVVPLEARA